MVVNNVLMSTGLILDLSIAGIILLFVVIGIFMGFFRSILSLVRFSGSFVIAFLLRKPCGAMLDKLFKITPKLTETLTTTFSGYSAELISTTSADPQTLKNLVNASDMSGILKRLCGWMIGSEQLGDATTVIDLVSSKAGTILCSVIAVAVLFIILRIFTFLIGRLFKKLAKKRTLGKLDRLLGAVFGLVKGAAVVVAMFFVMSLASAIPTVSDKVTTATQQSKICSILYEPVNDFIYEKIGLNKE